MNYYKSSASGVYLLGQNDDPAIKISGPVAILSRTCSPDGNENFGKYIQWKSITGRLHTEVFLLRDIVADKGKSLRERLVDTGLYLPADMRLWGHLVEYILQAEPEDELICVDRTGWVNSIYVTPNWVSGDKNKNIILKDKSEIESLNQNGTLIEWRDNLAALSAGNPLMMFTIAASLAAPFIGCMDWDSYGIHFYGSSKEGKTTLLKIATSVYSDSEFADSWRGTANGIEARARSRNDMPLFLDELHQATADEVDQIIYMLGNGVSKLRATKNAGLKKQGRWSILYLSSGEIGLSEKLAEARKKPTAGQFMRFFEIPVTRKFGAFDEIHSFSSAKDFADTLNESTNKYYGTALKPWIDYMANSSDMKGMIREKMSMIKDSWRHYLSEEDGNQMNFAMDRFALIAAAGELAVDADVLPWEAGEAASSVGKVFESWRANLDSGSDYEEEVVANGATKLVKNWIYSLTKVGDDLDDSSPGYWRIEDGEVIWYMTKSAFKKGFGLNFTPQFVSTAHLLNKKNWLVSNEKSRGTFKSSVSGKQERYYKIRPQKIYKDLSLDISFKHFFEEVE